VTDFRLEIRDAVPEDVQSIVQIWIDGPGASVIPDVPILGRSYHDYFCDSLVHPRTKVWVACQNATIAGWVALNVFRFNPALIDTMAEISFYTNQQFKRKGVGRAMIMHALQHAQENTDLEWIFAITAESNTAAIQLLEDLNAARLAPLPPTARNQKRPAAALWAWCAPFQ
jgi:RimJ/RimL family protein N-acetyltransferase